MPGIHCCRHWGYNGELCLVSAVTGLPFPGSFSPTPGSFIHKLRKGLGLRKKCLGNGLECCCGELVVGPKNTGY